MTPLRSCVASPSIGTDYTVEQGTLYCKALGPTAGSLSRHQSDLNTNRPDRHLAAVPGGGRSSWLLTGTLTGSPQSQPISSRRRRAMAKRGSGQGAVYLRGDGRWEAQI